MKVRSLILFDLKDTIIYSNKKVLEFVSLYDIKNKTDINNLFIYNALLHILEIYKNNKGGLVVFYISQENFNDLADSKELINYKKFIKLITKKIKFPIIISTFDFYYFCKTEPPIHIFNNLWDYCREYSVLSVRATLLIQKCRQIILTSISEY